MNSPLNVEQIGFEAFLDRPWYYDLSSVVQTSTDPTGGVSYEHRYAKIAVVWPL